VKGPNLIIAPQQSLLAHDPLAIAKATHAYAAGQGPDSEAIALAPAESDLSADLGAPQVNFGRTVAIRRPATPPAKPKYRFSISYDASLFPTYNRELLPIR
jgi:hypothetical protein